MINREAYELMCDEIDQYKAIGTVEECREAVDKRETKKIDRDKLIETFSDMAKRGTLLCGEGVTQEDILNQIIGTIVKASMDESLDNLPEQHMEFLMDRFMGSEYE